MEIGSGIEDICRRYEPSNVVTYFLAHPVYRYWDLWQMPTVKLFLIASVCIILLNVYSCVMRGCQMFACVVLGLYQIKAQIMSQQDCRALGSAYYHVTHNMLCVQYNEVGENFCTLMLAGSSLVCRQGNSWWQYGFVSWGVGRCPNATRPQVHSNVVKYLPWINQITRGQFVHIYHMVSHTVKCKKNCSLSPS